MIRSLLSKVLVLTLGALALTAMLAVHTKALADSPAAGQKPALQGAEPTVAPQAEFPPYPEVEYERSVIRIPVKLGGDLQPREILELTAFMKLEREAPVRNTIGYRQFEFTIREWELFGYSEFLGAHVSFAASPDVIQPKSLGVALQKESDFPALIVYNAIYDIFLDGRKIVAQRPGVAMARGIMEIPPRNITVAFQKPFTVMTGHDEAAASGGKRHGPCMTLQQLQDYRCWIFLAGACEDMVTITAEEFNAGLQEARAIRSQMATLKPKPLQPVKPEAPPKPTEQPAKSRKVGRG